MNRERLATVIGGLGTVLLVLSLLGGAAFLVSFLPWPASLPASAALVGVALVAIAAALDD